MKDHSHHQEEVSSHRKEQLRKKPVQQSPGDRSSASAYYSFPERPHSDMSVATSATSQSSASTSKTPKDDDSRAAKDGTSSRLNQIAARVRRDRRRRSKSRSSKDEFRSPPRDNIIIANSNSHDSTFTEDSNESSLIVHKQKILRVPETALGDRLCDDEVLIVETAFEYESFHNRSQQHAPTFVHRIFACEVPPKEEDTSPPKEFTQKPPKSRIENDYFKAFERELRQSKFVAAVKQGITQAMQEFKKLECKMDIDCRMDDDDDTYDYDFPQDSSVTSHFVETGRPLQRKPSPYRQDGMNNTPSQDDSMGFLTASSSVSISADVDTVEVVSAVGEPSNAELVIGLHDSVDPPGAVESNVGSSFDVPDDEKTKNQTREGIVDSPVHAPHDETATTTSKKVAVVGSSTSNTIRHEETNAFKFSPLAQYKAFSERSDSIAGSSSSSQTSSSERYEGTVGSSFSKFSADRATLTKTASATINRGIVGSSLDSQSTPTPVMPMNDGIVGPFLGFQNTVHRVGGRHHRSVDRVPCNDNNTLRIKGIVGSSLDSQDSSERSRTPRYCHQVPCNDNNTLRIEGIVGSSLDSQDSSNADRSRTPRYCHQVPCNDNNTLRIEGIVGSSLDSQDSSADANSRRTPRYCFKTPGSPQSQAITVNTTFDSCNSDKTNGSTKSLTVRKVISSSDDDSPSLNSNESSAASSPFRRRKTNSPRHGRLVELRQKSSQKIVRSRVQR